MWQNLVRRASARLASFLLTPAKLCAMSQMRSVVGDLLFLISENASPDGEHRDT
jgi:hypothetical protein